MLGIQGEGGRGRVGEKGDKRRRGVKERGKGDMRRRGRKMGENRDGERKERGEGEMRRRGRKMRGWGVEMERGRKGGKEMGVGVRRVVDGGSEVWYSVSVTVFTLSLPFIYPLLTP